MPPSVFCVTPARDSDTVASWVVEKSAPVASSFSAETRVDRSPDTVTLMDFKVPSAGLNWFTPIGALDPVVASGTITTCGVVVTVLETNRPIEGLEESRVTLLPEPP
jgi:hypothetical protein